MNIGRLHLDRRGDQHVRQLHNRGVIALLDALQPVHFATGLHVGRTGVLIELGHRGLNLRLGRDDRLDVAPVEDVTQRVDRIVTHRVGQRNRD